MDAYLLNKIIKIWMKNMYTNLRIVVTSGDSEKKLVDGRIPSGLQHYEQNLKIKILSKNGNISTFVKCGC